MLKKISLILVLVILINGCRSFYERDGKIYGEFTVTETVRDGIGNNYTVHLKGKGTIVLEGTTDPMYRKPITMTFGKDTPLPNCVIELDFYKIQHEYIAYIEKGTTPHTVDADKKITNGCRGYFSKDEPLEEVVIESLEIVSDKGASANYNLTFGYYPVGNMQKRRSFQLLGDRGWF